MPPPPVEDLVDRRQVQPVAGGFERPSDLTLERQTLFG